MAIAVIQAHWAGNEERKKVFLFYLNEGEIFFFGNSFQRLGNHEWWWPDHAEAYQYYWEVVPLTNRLDIVILDRHLSGL